MLIHELTKDPGRNQKAKRLGRGDASGKGNYSTRGLKGQKSRSGVSIPVNFEGGQTPLYRRIPKLRGFKRPPKFTKTNQPVNIGRLDQDDQVADKATITKQDLVDWGHIRSAKKPVKVLGNTKISKELTFEGMDGVSDHAKAHIEAAGGSIDLLEDNSDEAGPQEQED